MTWEKTDTQWLRFRGSNNTRDLAGFRSRDGRVIPAGRLIRSGALSQIGKRSAQQLKEKYRVRLMVDLRTEGERTRHPAQHLEDVELRHIPVLENAMMGITQDDASTVEKVRNLVQAGVSERDFMIRVYTSIISDSHAIAAYRELFQALLVQEEGATMYFCSHGRDRTGIATLLIMSVLDVPLEEIRADYLVMPMQEARQQRLVAALGKLHLITPEQAQFAKTFSAPSAERFDYALQWINRYYGSVQRYLEQEIRMGAAERERFQRLYLKEVNP